MADKWVGFPNTAGSPSAIGTSGDYSNGSRRTYCRRWTADESGTISAVNIRPSYNCTSDLFVVVYKQAQGSGDIDKIVQMKIDDDYSQDTWRGDDTAEAFNSESLAFVSGDILWFGIGFVGGEPPTGGLTEDEDDSSGEVNNQYQSDSVNATTGPETPLSPGFSTSGTHRGLCAILKYSTDDDIPEEAAPISSVGTITAAGEKSTSSAGPVSGAGTITSAGNKAISEAAPVGSVGSITATGQKMELGEDPAPIAGVGVITSIGQKSTETDASVSGAGTIITAGTKISSEAAPISSVGVITVAGEKVAEVAEVAAPLSSVGSITTTGTKQARGPPAPLSSIGTITADGEKATSSAAPVEGVGTITVAVEKVITTGVLIATFSLRKPTTTFSLSKPTITFTLRKPTIIFS